MLQGFAVFVFKLQQVVASFFYDLTGIVLITVQGIATDQGVFQVRLLVESAGNRKFSVPFVVLATGFFLGDADGYRGPALMLAEANREHLVAHILAVYGQGPGKGSGVPLHVQST